MLVLVGQGLIQLLSRSGPDISGLRALGATGGQAALAVSLPGGVAVLAGVILAVAGAGHADARLSPRRGRVHPAHAGARSCDRQRELDGLVFGETPAGFVQFGKPLRPDGGDR
jgi:hypothetical protein